MKHALIGLYMVNCVCTQPSMEYLPAGLSLVKAYNRAFRVLQVWHGASGDLCVPMDTGKYR